MTRLDQDTASPLLSDSGLDFRDSKIHLPSSRQIIIWNIQIGKEMSENIQACPTLEIPETASIKIEASKPSPSLRASV